MFKIVEEVSMKWMKRQSFTEMKIGGVYEMGRQKKCQKMEIPLKWIKCKKLISVKFYIEVYQTTTKPVQTK